MTCLMTRDERIVDAMELVRLQARRFPKLPAGINADDLESAGHEALMEASATYDPQAGASFRTYARTIVKGRMLDAIQAQRRRAGRQTTLEVDKGEGDMEMRIDAREPEPSDRAAAREILAMPSGKRLGPLAEGPDPAKMASRAAMLRDAMLSAISEADVVSVMQAVTAKAKAGDTRSARLFFDLISPAKVGATVVQQQAIIVHSDDI